MAKDEATYAERLPKANDSLAEKQKKMEEETDTKFKLIRQSLSKDYNEKAKDRKSVV